MSGAGMPTTPLGGDPLSFGLKAASAILSPSTPSSSFSTGSSNAVSGFLTNPAADLPTVDLVGDDTVFALKTGNSLESKIMLGVLVALGTSAVLALMKRA